MATNIGLREKDEMEMHGGDSFQEDEYNEVDVAKALAKSKRPRSM